FSSSYLDILIYTGVIVVTYIGLTILYVGMGAATFKGSPLEVGELFKLDSSIKALIPALILNAVPMPFVIMAKRVEGMNVNYTYGLAVACVGALFLVIGIIKLNKIHKDIK
ncbi:MAG: hypothetical protein RSC49_10250, partial [Clostridium sp.]